MASNRLPNDNNNAQATPTATAAPAASE